MREKRLEVRRLGRVAYDDALRLQNELETEVIEKRKNDYLLLLEHPHASDLAVMRVDRDHCRLDLGHL